MWTLRILGLDRFEGQALCFQTALPSFPKHLGRALASQMRKRGARLFQPCQSPDDRLHLRITSSVIWMGKPAMNRSSSSPLKQLV
jgi:hypothetical protein